MPAYELLLLLVEQWTPAINARVTLHLPFTASTQSLENTPHISWERTDPTLCLLSSCYAGDTNLIGSN